MVRRSNKWIAEILSSTSGNDNDKQLAFDIQAFTYRPRLDELPPSLLSLLSPAGTTITRAGTKSLSTIHIRKLN